MKYKVYALCVDGVSVKIQYWVTRDIDLYCRWRVLSGWVHWLRLCIGHIICERTNVLFGASKKTTMSIRPLVYQSHKEQASTMLYNTFISMIFSYNSFMKHIIYLGFHLAQAQVYDANKTTPIMAELCTNWLKMQQQSDLWSICSTKILIFASNNMFTVHILYN